MKKSYVLTTALAASAVVVLTTGCNVEERKERREERREERQERHEERREERQEKQAEKAAQDKLQHDTMTPTQPTNSQIKVNVTKPAGS